MNADLDILPCGYLSFKDSGVITACNRTLVSWLGYSRAELVGNSIERILTLPTRIFYNTHFFPLIKLQSKANEIFLTLKSKNNDDIPVLANAERRLDQETHIIHCVFIQVHERKKYEHEILAAKREAENALKENKGLQELTKSLEQHAIELDKQYRSQIVLNENLLQFSKIISHDLQEPIRKIQIFVDMISRDQENVLNDSGRSFLSKINSAAKKLRTLTTGLNQYVSVSGEKSLTHVDLNEIINLARARAVNARQFDDFDMQVQKLPVVEGYKNQLELLFFHLIDNAIQFRHPGRRLSITIGCLVLEENIYKVSTEKYKYAEHMRMSFSDNGMGFSPLYRDYVFEPLKKIDSSTPGLGLGLPLVKRIVANHSGTIIAEPQPEVGTRFEIELPVKML